MPRVQSSTPLFRPLGRGWLRGSRSPRLRPPFCRTPFGFGATPTKLQTELDPYRFSTDPDLQFLLSYPAIDVSVCPEHVQITASPRSPHNSCLTGKFRGPGDPVREVFHMHCQVPTISNLLVAVAGGVEL